MELGLDLMLLLCLVAILAGFLDTLAGGGGLITLPALLISGLPVIQALSTNKLQSSAGTFTASCMMILKGQVKIREIYPYFIAAFIGSVIGTLCVKLIDAEQLKIIIPFVVSGIGLYFLFVPQIGQEQKQPVLSPRAYQLSAVPLIGAYDGMFGPGTGSFFALSNILLQGQKLIQATARAKILNFATNSASLCVFAYAGDVVWVLGSIMIIGQFIGAYLGARMVLSHGMTMVRPMIVLMCFVMMIKYLYDMFY